MAMSFKVIAGDFHSLSRYSSSRVLNEKKLIAGILNEDGSTRVEEINIKGNIELIEIVTEESKKKFIGSAGWGLVGAAALGPVGMIAGVLAGGNKKEICFVCTLKDGRKFMAISDIDTYQEFFSAQYEREEKPKQTKNNPWIPGIIFGIIGFLLLKILF